MARVIISIRHDYTASLALPVHEGDDGHEVEGKRHERHPQLAQGVVEGGGEEHAAIFYGKLKSLKNMFDIWLT